MNAAAHRVAAPNGVRTEIFRTGDVADVTALLDALPIAAGVFGFKHGKLWVHALNKRFFETAGCGGDPKAFGELFLRHGEGSGGDFVRDFLAVMPAKDKSPQARAG